MRHAGMVANLVNCAQLPAGIAAKVLKSLGVNLKDARVEVEKIIGRGSGFVAVEIPFTPRAKRVLEMSLDEARQLGEPGLGSVRSPAAQQAQHAIFSMSDQRCMPLHNCAGHNYIGTEHILLGLLREGEGVAARVLETLGADPAKIRTQVRMKRCDAVLTMRRVFTGFDGLHV